jgi:hypothetical protein
MATTAQRTGMANGHGSRREIHRTIRTAKLAGNVARDLVRALRALEGSLDCDYYGRVVWTADESPEHAASAVTDLLRLARGDYPSQEIEVNVLVRVSEEEVPAGGNSPGQ